MNFSVNFHDNTSDGPYSPATAARGIFPGKGSRPMIRMSRRLSGFLFLALALFALPVSSVTRAVAETLVVLHTNDHHGRPAAFPFIGGQAAAGLPARATLVESIRAANENVLVLDAGDINTGRPESNLFAGRPDILGYNFIGYDAVVLGNHEFDRGLDALAGQMALAEFPFLSANIRKSCGELFAQPYIIKSFDGFDAAVFGLTTTDTTAITHPGHIIGLRFEDEVETARALVPRLRETADVVIALVHLGIYDTPRRGSIRLAREVPGIDLVVDGHSHTRLDEPVWVKNRVSGALVPVVQAWKWGLLVGRVDLEVSPRGARVTAFESIPVNLPPELTGRRGIRAAQDERLSAILEPFSRKADELLSVPVAYVPARITHRDGRRSETRLGALVADSMMWAAREFKPDFSVQNSGGIRDDIPRGMLTARTVHQVLPFENTVAVVDLPGKAVRRLLAHMAAGAASDGKGFPQVSAELRMAVDRRSGGVISVSIGGEPFDPERTYRVATNSYMAAGGDGYRVLPESGRVHDTSICQREAMMGYLRTLGSRFSPPAPEPRITRQP